MILLKNVTKSYKNGNILVDVLKNINLKIPENSFTALLGRSGSGKTTLMNIIGCLDSLDEGNYYLDNNLINKLNIKQLADIRNKYIGFVFQKFYLLPQFTALENVALPLFYQDVNQKTRLLLAEQMLSKLGLGERIHHKPNQLSGGQQQRVAIARALITNPKIILADEPTGNLDSESGQYVMSFFRELHQQGKTIVLITHDQKIAELADSQVYLEDGMIITNHAYNSSPELQF